MAQRKRSARHRADLTIVETSPSWIQYDPIDIFRALNAAGVKYMVVGGIAAILHGVNRFTWDVDLAVELTTPNLSRLARALEQLGFVRRVPVPIQGLASMKKRRAWLEGKGMKVYSFIERKPPQRVVDVMVNPPEPFGQVYRRRMVRDAGGVAVPVVPVDVLVSMKRAAGRPEDVVDIQMLKQIAEFE